MFSLIYVCINGWVNNRETGDLRRYRAHYDVSVMKSSLLSLNMPYPSRNLTAVIPVIVWLAVSTGGIHGNNCWNFWESLNEKRMEIL